MLSRAIFRRPLILLLTGTAFLAVVRLAAWPRERDGKVPAGLRMVATSFGQIAVDERGPSSGPTVLIVPGTAGWSGFWREGPRIWLSAVITWSR